MQTQQCPESKYFTCGWMPFYKVIDIWNTMKKEPDTYSHHATPLPALLAAGGILVRWERRLLHTPSPVFGILLYGDGLGGGSYYHLRNGKVEGIAAAAAAAVGVIENAH